MVAIAKAEIISGVEIASCKDLHDAQPATNAASRHTRLLQHAKVRGITWEPDYVHDGALIMREPARRHRCEIVSAEGCSCDHYRFWRFCVHSAVFEAVKGGEA